MTLLFFIVTSNSIFHMKSHFLFTHRIDWVKEMIIFVILGIILFVFLAYYEGRT